MTHRYGALVLLLSACGDPRPEDIASQAPALGTGGGDQADHACQLVLRTVQRMTVGEGYETDCTAGPCQYVWRGAIEVAGEVAMDVSVRVLYHLVSDPNWWEVEATPDAGAAPGFRRYAFRISEHLFGPDVEPSTIELVPFLRLQDGSRLFDHNRYPSDFQNHQLTASYYYTAGDGGVCQPVVGTISFTNDWRELAWGLRRQGGYLVIDYDIARLPQCRGTHNGYPAWDVVAYAKFLPGGQLVSGSVRQIVTNMGTPTNEATNLPLTVQIPGDATAVELWFHNYTGAGSSCEAWDSDYGANYRFDIWPPAAHPRCRDVEIRNGTFAEDRRMYLANPHCLSYDVAAQYDARYCELHVDAVAHGFVGHYGIPFEWLLAYLAVPAQQGDVLAAGIYTRYHDSTTAKSGQRFSLGKPVAANLWETGFAYHVTGFADSGGSNDTVDQLAFFIDVRRPSGEVIRLWQSRGGANYHWDDAFSLPTTGESIPYGNLQWANDASVIYESRRACP